MINRRTFLQTAGLALGLSLLPSPLRAVAEESLLFLEENSSKTLSWANRETQKTVKTFREHRAYRPITADIRNILNDKRRIIDPTIYGNFVYNYWRDEKHHLGIIRRTSKELFVAGNPQWETLLDIDRLSRQEKETWSFKGMAIIPEDQSKILVYLSPGGSDLLHIRELSTTSKKLEPQGFSFTPSKGWAHYLAPDRFISCASFGPDTLTLSQYPRQVRTFKRGQDPKEGTLLLECKKEDIGIWQHRIRHRDQLYDLLIVYHSYYHNSSYLVREDGTDKLNYPSDALLHSVYDGQAIVLLQSPLKAQGKTFPEGSFVTCDLQDLAKGEPSWSLLKSPEANEVLESVSSCKDYLVLHSYHHLSSLLRHYRYEEGDWKLVKTLSAPSLYRYSITGQTGQSNDYFVTEESYLTPRKLRYIDLDENQMPHFDPRTFYQLPHFFKDHLWKSEMHFATSKDGTQVPYALIVPKSWKGEALPCLLTAYGGFNRIQKPRYLQVIGNAWLERSKGIYVIAFVRGGGEFGPAWSQAGRGLQKHHAFEDLLAVAQDLQANNYTDPQNLLLTGGSNGGMVVGATIALKPKLFKAALMQVPLLDMQRFHLLLAGDSWKEEYGDPQKAEVAQYWQKYSPLHRIRKGIKYPRTLFTTNRKDDRVHPAHARKMAYQLQQFKQEVFYYEDDEGGHGGSPRSSLKNGYVTAIEFCFFLNSVGL